jgi:hypothetical protein
MDLLKRLFGGNNTAPQIGDLDDGGVYVGLSESDGKPLHAALADLPEYKTFEEALAAAEQLKAEHSTAHVPTPDELDVNLYQNRNKGELKRTFSTWRGFPDSRYLSSEPYYGIVPLVKAQNFNDGTKDFSFMDTSLPVRLVW